MSLVCGVLVTYNPNIVCFEFQIKTLIKQLDYLIVIDNFSVLQQKMQTIALLASNSIVFENQEDNLGLGAAQNIGIKKAAELKATHVVLFDQDSMIEQEFIAGLLDAEAALLKEDKQVGAVGPLFYDPDNNVVYPATVYTGPFLKRVSLDKFIHEVEATFIIASGCLIRMEVVNKVGLMNCRLFIDYIDVDWSLRAKSSGFNVYMTSRAKMAHTVGDKRANVFGRTVSIHSPLRRYYLIRNSFFMLRQSYIPFGYKLREVSFNLLRFLTGLLFSSERIKYLHYSFWGIRDGIVGVFGPCKYRL